MATDWVKKYEPNGEIDFGTAHDEDTKGTADEYHTAKLTSAGGKLVLVTTTKRTTTYKIGQETCTTAKYEIEPQQLIDLIEANGRRA